jgi:predicted CxxxxCH...CXXCH cytochrome family protein
VLHINGVVDTLTRDSAICNTCHGPNSSCTRCHGGTDNQTGAPPSGLSGETSVTQTSVGAHTAHVETGSIAGSYECTQCHIKPVKLADQGHLGADSIAEVVWGGISGSSSQWSHNNKTCNSTYCHGNFSGGKRSNSPVWTGMNQASCGSCHDVGGDPASLLWKHELHITSFGLKCADCHASVVDTLLQVSSKTLHVNGVVDTLTRDPAVCNVCHGPGPGSCVTCHGGTDNQTGAPPEGLRGETQTTQIAVGAHTAHIQTAAIASVYDCNQCHIKPTKFADPGHFGLDSLAEVIWGGIAGSGSQWTRSNATCKSTYCHGNFSGGNVSNSPVWTGASQANCGSCHDVGSNPANLLWKHDLHVTTYGLKCNDCHANVVNSSLQIIGKNLHVNGVVDTLRRDPAVCDACHGPGGFACTSCHGGIDNQTGAPPDGLRGETLTTQIAVGAHTAHVQTAAIAGTYDCDQCHLKPVTFTDPGHLGADSIAEIVWGGIAGSGSIWNRTAKTCSSTYCHGKFSGGDGTNTPIWTASGQAHCGSCHDIGIDPASLLWKHNVHINWFGLACADCHAGVIDLQLNFVNKNLHVNGVVDTLRRDPVVCDKCHKTGPDQCVRCHGGTDNQTGAPPTGLRGETVTTTTAVGAHSGHVQIGTIANAFDCTFCHNKPATIIASGHLDADSIAEVVWHGISGTAGVWNRTAKTCSNTYCHGRFTGGSTTNTPMWTASNQAACGTCHDVGTSPSLLGGRHRDHVQEEGIACQRCHASTVDTNKLITGKSLHVNGVNNVNFSPATGSYSNGTCSNPAGCHGTEDW